MPFWLTTGECCSDMVVAGIVLWTTDVVFVTSAVLVIDEDATGGCSGVASGVGVVLELLHAGVLFFGLVDFGFDRDDEEEVFFFVTGVVTGEMTLPMSLCKALSQIDIPRI